MGKLLKEMVGKNVAKMNPGAFGNFYRALESVADDLNSVVKEADNLDPDDDNFYNVPAFSMTTDLDKIIKQIEKIKAVMQKE